MSNLELLVAPKPIKTRCPTKPSPPRSKKTIRKFTSYWKSTTIKKLDSDHHGVPLLEALKSIPTDVSLKDIFIYRNEFYPWRDTIHIGFCKETDNPKYLSAKKKYDEKMADYKSKLAKWDVEKDRYDKEYEAYKKNCDLHKLIKKREDLSTRLSKLNGASIDKAGAKSVKKKVSKKRTSKKKVTKSRTSKKKVSAKRRVK